MQEMRVQSLGWKDTLELEKEMATHSSILIWKSPGQRSLAAYNPWVEKSQTQQVRYQHYYMGLYFNQLVYNHLYSLALILKVLHLKTHRKTSCKA